jgi:hypothetical protein
MYRTRRAGDGHFPQLPQPTGCAHGSVGSPARARAAEGPRLAFPLVVRPVDLAQLGGRDLALQLGEHAARADRRELRLVADEDQLAFLLGGHLDQRR